MQGAKQLDCDAACGLPSLRCGHVLAQLSDPRRAVLASEVPRSEHEAIAPDKWHIGGRRRGWRGQGDAQLAELVVNSHGEGPGFRDEVSLRETVLSKAGHPDRPETCRGRGRTGCRRSAIRRALRS